jgi:hypothetical protein
MIDSGRDLGSLLRHQTKIVKQDLKVASASEYHRRHDFENTISARSASGSKTSITSSDCWKAERVTQGAKNIPPSITATTRAAFLL